MELVELRYRTIIAVLVCLLFSKYAYAENDISVLIDNKPIAFDVEPKIASGRTFVPMRKIFEELGCDVEWISEEQIILATKDSSIIILKIGNNKLIIKDVLSNENKVIELDVAPFVENGRTLVPIRYVSEALSCKVDWDDQIRTVIITR